MLQRAQKADTLFVIAVTAIAAALILPTRGGVLLYYMDNPIHIAEVHALATEAYRGWSDMAYTGFLLGGMQSPICYGLLELGGRVGLPIEPLYGLFLLFGFIAPSLALYVTARRRGMALAALPAVVTLLLLPAVVVGAGSVFGGMWTFNMSIGILILLIDQLTRRDTSSRHWFALAALTGVALLTHLYVSIAIAAVMIGRAVIQVVQRAFSLRATAIEASAMAAGFIGACVYWGPFAATGSLTAFEAQHLTMGGALMRLFMPERVMDIVLRRASLTDHLWQGIPIWLLTALFIAGIVRLRRERDTLSVYGTILVLTIIALVVGVAGNVAVRFLGPFSWRLLTFAYAGMACAALPVAGDIVARLAGRATAVVGAFVLLAIVHAAAMGMSLQAVAPATNAPVVRETHELWQWLHDNRNATWGRVYLQDTFQLRGDHALHQSHILALTAREAGVRQLGPSYGLPMYETGKWTPSEFGTLFRRAARPESIEYIRQRMWLTNSTHVVTSDAPTTAFLRQREDFELLYERPPFFVFSTGFQRQWAAAQTNHPAVRVPSFQTGRIDIDVNPSGALIDVLVKVSYHPFWRLDSDAGGEIVQSRFGLIAVQGVGPDAGRMRLEFDPPAWPTMVSVLAWLLIAAVGAWTWRRSQRVIPPQASVE